MDKEMREAFEAWWSNEPTWTSGHGIAEDAWQAACKYQRERDAEICKIEADKMEAEAQRCERDEPDEVSSIRSTAWKLALCADAILNQGSKDETKP